MAELGEENALGLIRRTLFISGHVIYPQRDEVICSLQVPTGDADTDHHMRSIIKSTGNLAIQKFRYWIFHSMYDLVGGTIRQVAALGFLGSKVLKRLQRRVEIWMTGEQRTSMSRSLAVESEQLLDVVRVAAVNHVARYYMVRKAKYPASQAEDMRRRELGLERSTAWALARNEAVALDSNGYPCSPTSPARDSSKCDESSGDELFGSD